MSFGRKIKFYREKNGITQGKLAKGICSIPYLSKIENNKTIPSEEVLHLLCERLGISYIQRDCLDDGNVSVRNDLMEWYRLITNRNIEQAKKGEEKISTNIRLIEDPDILILYQLFSFKYKLLLKDYKKCELIHEDLKSAMDNFTSEHQFYYYYFSGFYYYTQNNLIDSLDLLTKAELIGQELGKKEPELLYLMSLVHSRLSHISLAIHYANLALPLFNNEMNYIKSIETNIILSINYIRLHRYEQAYTILQNSLTIANSLNNQYLIVVIYHNLGYLHSKTGEYEKAMDYYLRSLEMKNEKDTRYINTVLYLVECLIIAGKISEAISWIRKGIEISIKSSFPEYNIRLSLLKLELEDDVGLINYLEEIAFPFFQRKKNWELISGLSEKLATLYADQNKYKKSSQYYCIANDARKKLQSEANGN